ncbi:hypothetical protein ScPMuIL_008203 [Solemya velum]
MAYSCANTTGKTDDKSVIFTRIPATPDHVRVEWLTRLHREDIDPKKFLPGKDHVLCSRHFDERCFEIDMALKLMKGVEKRKFKDTTTIVPTIFSHVRPTAPRPNTEQRMAKKAKDKMMDQLLHGPDDPSQASEEACLVAVENIQPPVAKRPRPKSRCKWPTLVDAETQTEVVIMCDGETQVERTSTTGVGTQWPEYEQNLLAEPDKCVLDHSYNAPVPVHSTIQKPLQQTAVYTCLNISEQSVIDQDIDESAIDAEQSPAEGMDESDESFHLESEDSASGSDMSTDSQQPAVSDIKFVTFQSCLLRAVWHGLLFYVWAGHDGYRHQHSGIMYFIFVPQFP